MVNFRVQLFIRCSDPCQLTNVHRNYFPNSNGSCLCGWLMCNCRNTSWPSVYLFNHLSSPSFLSSAVCVGQQQFLDQYFDNPKFDLTLRDMWLRKRKGCWELKCPAEETSGEQSRAAALCTRYKEITTLPEIQLRVTEVIPDVCEDRDSETASSYQDESWLSRRNLACFAEFTTVRQSFNLEEGGVRIDLDKADFGYHVGELEVIVPEGGDVQAALEKIERTAQKLGELKASIPLSHLKPYSTMYHDIKLPFLLLYRSDRRSAS